MGFGVGGRKVGVGGVEGGGEAAGAPNGGDVGVLFWD